MTNEDDELLDFFLNAKPEKLIISEQEYKRLVKIPGAKPEPNPKLEKLLKQKVPLELSPDGHKHMNMIDRIETEKDYDAVLKRIEELIDVQPGTSEGDELDALVILVEQYESTHHRID